MGNLARGALSAGLQQRCLTVPVDSAECFPRPAWLLPLGPPVHALGLVAHEMAVAASASFMCLSGSWIDSCGQRAGQARRLGGSEARRVERQYLFAMGNIPVG